MRPKSIIQKSLLWAEWAPDRGYLRWLRLYGPVKRIVGLAWAHIVTQLGLALQGGLPGQCWMYACTSARALLTLNMIVTVADVFSLQHTPCSALCCYVK